MNETNTSRPEPMNDETMVAYFARLDAWKNEGNWAPASGGTEEAFTTRTGARLLYVYQARSGKHAYLDLGSDLILTDAEARNLLGTW